MNRRFVSTVQLLHTHTTALDKAVIRVYDAAGNLTETHEHAGELKDDWGEPPPFGLWVSY
jgi:hypothetical protein